MFLELYVYRYENIQQRFWN